MSYRPGTHLIATLLTAVPDKLNDFSALQVHIDSLITRHRLQKLGEVYHNFSPAGYTGVVCLSESHLSFHTWPEYGKMNIDIYLSNHARENEGTVNELYVAIKSFLEAETEHLEIIKR